MKILYFGDIFGRPGRDAIAAALPFLHERWHPDFILGNVENLAGGRGVNRKSLQELVELGFHGFTSGNHIWDNKEVYTLFSDFPQLFRPSNYPSPEETPCPGKGYGVLSNQKGSQLFIVNVLGRVFMDALECPFHACEIALKANSEKLPVLVDVHAEATSEKYALGWFLNGKAALVVGSHSHVQTADERILSQGTAYITDVGLNGSFDSVIGLHVENAIRRFQTKRPVPFEVATANPGVSCVLVEIDSFGRASRITRFRQEIHSFGVGR